jgi:hypothetical protein
LMSYPIELRRDFIHGDALTFTVNSLTVVLREFRCQSPVG